MSVIMCSVACPYCHERQVIETDQVKDHLDFTDELDNDTVETDDIVNRCVKCDRRFVVSIDLTVDVFESAIVGEAEKPSGSGQESALARLKEG